MQQNATFCLPEQVYAKDVALYERLFPAFDRLTFICFLAVGKTKESVVNTRTENIFIYFTRCEGRGHR